MNVLFDYQVFGHNRYGGTSRYFSEMISALAKESSIGLTVFLGLYLNRYVSREFRQGLHRTIGTRHPGIKGTWKAVRQLNRWWFNEYALRKIENFDIYHPTYFHVWRGPKCRCRRVVTVYDMIPEKFPNYISPRDDTHRTKREAVDAADAVIAISDTTKSDLVELFGTSPDKVHVVSLGSSLRERNLSRDAVREFLPKPYILYVGRRTGYKNFHRFLTAYLTDNRLRRDFYVVCFGGGTFTPSELALVKEGGGEGRVLQVSGDDGRLADTYRNAAVLVVPSLYEGFGLPAIEAMSLGCPVAASRGGALPEILGEAGCLFDPSSVDDVRSVLARVLYDSSLRERLIALGLERASLFTWDKCAQETIEVYRSLS